MRKDICWASYLNSILIEEFSSYIINISNTFHTKYLFTNEWKTPFNNFFKSKNIIFQ